MATVTSHTLNSVDGTHAGGIVVTCCKIGNDGTREVVFETVTDGGGRFSESIERPDANRNYELVFQTADYFSARSQQSEQMQILRDVVIRIEMPNPDGLYHFPLMLAPNSYSVWWSS